MMNQQTIEVTIGADGSVKVEGFNFHGSACDKALKEVEQAIGGVVSGRKFKPEHFEREVKPVQKVGGR
jgi:hypothetical protein